ncbi:GyrI-like domain-containing protein [Paenibacillus sp. NPDC057934]|uniref:GyrI-like domain-containing protein n=1 Tax=Paenibacillus sp. NPDC057934 TaxID=3346282 RepID=UPI0036DA1B57
MEVIWKNDTHDQINEAVGRPVGSLLNGNYFDFSEDGNKSYMTGVELPEGRGVPDGLNILQIPNPSYAVFDSRGSIPDDMEIGLEILNVWKRMYSEWCPSTNLVNDDHTESICEVWIPVRRKS